LGGTTPQNNKKVLSEDMNRGVLTHRELYEEFYEDKK